MTDVQKIKCDEIIQQAATVGATAAASLSQLPGSDKNILIGIQISMVLRLAEVFEKSLTELTAKTLVVSVLATHTGRIASQLLLGWVPFVGNVLNAGTAFTLIRKVGWTIAQDFDKKQ